MDSFIEAAINIVIGFIISWIVLDWLVSPLFGWHTKAGESFAATMIFTVTSFARQYLIRRWLNGKIIWERWLHANSKGPF